jgi:hypothetical protein
MKVELTFVKDYQPEVMRAYTGPYSRDPLLEEEVKHTVSLLQTNLKEANLSTVSGATIISRGSTAEFKDITLKVLLFKDRQAYEARNL